MAIQNSFPAFKPTLLLDFAKTKRLDPRITFTRTTTATYYDGDTVAKTEENLLLQSQNYATSWTVTNLTPVTGKTAPDSTSTATQFTAGAANAVLTQGYTAIADSYTFSVWLRRVTGTGNIDIAADNGTWTTKVITGTWARYDVTQTVAAGSKTAGIRVVTSGDAIEVWGAQLEQRSSVTAYTATTTQPITNYIPVLLTAPAGTARFNHNPVTEESLGLLIEEQRTNLTTYSSDFSNAAWIKARASITSNTIVAPDGTLTGDKLVEDTTASNTHFIEQTASVTNGITYTFSVYAKAAERTSIVVQFNAGTTYSTRFNLSAGTVIAGGTGTASIQSVGNGWYRCSLSAASTATATGYFDLFLHDGSSGSYTGNGYSGLFIWGAQLEAGAFPTSYIPTVAATVTRNADVASMTGPNFSSWYNQGEGAIYTELSSLSPLTLAQSTALSKYPAVFHIESGTTDTTVSWYGIAAGLDIGNTFNDLGSVPTGANKLAVNFSTTSGQGASSLNGAAAVSRNGALIGTATRLGIGSNLDFLSGSCLNGTIRKIAYYPLRVTNAQLQALTS